jgi:hypothetical protein
VRYDRFYNGHVCSPSRSAFNTGMYATTIGAHNHRTVNKKPVPEGVKVLSDWMRAAGYFTANVRELPPPCDFKGTGKTDWNFLYAGKPFDSANWNDLKTHQPFYAQVNFSETHRAYTAPKKADPAQVQIPPYYPDHPVTRGLGQVPRRDGRIGSQGGLGARGWSRMVSPTTPWLSSLATTGSRTSGASSSATRKACSCRRLSAGPGTSPRRRISRPGRWIGVCSMGSISPRPCWTLRERQSLPRCRGRSSWASAASRTVSTSSVIGTAVT